MNPVRHQPTPRLVEILAAPDVSSSAKIIYCLLDELGRGRPVAVQQEDLADLLRVSRKTVVLGLKSLRDRGFVRVFVPSSEDGKRILAYQTRITDKNQDTDVLWY